MSAFVVDASVVVKWFLPEVHTDAARRLLTLPHEYLAPDLLFAETANTIWKKIRRGELTPKHGRQLVDDIGRIAVETVPCRVLAVDAHELANATGRTVYDSLYLALAIRLKARMLTADERLAAAVTALPMTAAHIQLVHLQGLLNDASMAPDRTGPPFTRNGRSIGDLIGGERGIRSLGSFLESVTYRFQIARNARNASVAVGPCPFLPPEGSPLLCRRFRSTPNLLHDLTAATEVRVLEERYRPSQVDQAAPCRLQQNAQSTGNGQPLFTGDADAQSFIHEQQVGVLSCGQLNSLALSRIKSRQSCVSSFGHLLDREP